MASPDSSTIIDVTVCLVTVTPPRLVTIQMPVQATVAGAVHASGLPHGLDLTIDTCRLDVYSKHKAPDATLHVRGRVETLGPLVADPKMARQRRVQKVRTTGTHEGLKWLRNETPPKDDVLE